MTKLELSMNSKNKILLITFTFILSCQPPLEKSYKPSNNHVNPVINQVNDTSTGDPVLESSPYSEFEQLEHQNQFNPFGPTHIIKKIQAEPLLFSHSSRRFNFVLQFPKLPDLSASLPLMLPERVKFPFDELPKIQFHKRRVGVNLKNIYTVHSQSLLFNNFDLLALKIDYQLLEGPAQPTVYAFVYLNDDGMAIYIDQITVSNEQDHSTEWTNFIKQHLLSLHENKVYHDSEMLRLKNK